MAGEKIKKSKTAPKRNQRKNIGSLNKEAEHEVENVAKDNFTEDQWFPKMPLVSSVVIWANVLCVLCLYIFSAFPSVPGGDSGELLAEACQAGTAHPPGYPLYTASMHLLYSITHQNQLTFDIPAPSNYATFAWKVNIMSCFFGAGAAFFAARTAELWMRATWGEGLPWIAAAGSLLFALSPLTWEYSIGAEVFSLNNFLVAWLLYQTTRTFVFRGKVLDIALAAFICGLALSNQHTSALFEAILIPAVMFAALQSGRFTVFTTLVSAIAFLAGLSPYWYLTKASQVAKPGSWGEMTSFQSLVRHILRQEYGTFKLGVERENSEGMWERIYIYLEDACKQTFYLLPAFGCIGLVYCLLGRNMKTKALSLFLVATAVFYQLFWNGVLANLPLDAPMPRAVQSRFWMQPNLLLAIFASIGAGTVFAKTPMKKIKGLGVLLWLGIGGLLVWDRKDQMMAWKGAWHMHRYAEATLSIIPPNSLLVSHTDLDWNTIRYLRTCEGLRPDITHLSFQLMPFPWFSRQMKLYPNVTFPPRFEGISTNRFSHGNTVLIYRFLDLNIDQFPAVFIDMQSINEAELEVGGLWNGGFHLVPSGNLYRVYRALPDEMQAGKWAEDISQDLEEFKAKASQPLTKDFPEGSWEHAASSVYWDAHYQAGLFFLTWGLAVSHHLDENSLPAYAMALQKASDLLVATLKAWDRSAGLSSSYSDLLKNTVLCSVRLQGTLQVVEQFKDNILLPKGLEFQSETEARELAITLVKRFIKEVPHDKDVKAFEDYLKSTEGEESQQKNSS
eukprot:CAMPEP_0117762330 /NCGR_PEP_ID=MMETSP0947-20121206/17866_1 /TAXON_ID=44440 /ORGANISM="Chattonella subsalsa, Strain CCMP2191" /LENGTH=786 /DNA_ID=CAMNT_0005583601 /DNA_START=72 /DNA_END=2429 /DNA_ORIENTATION=+